MNNADKRKQKSFIFNSKWFGLVTGIVGAIFLILSIGFAFVPVTPDNMSVIRNGVQQVPTTHDAFVFKSIFLGVFSAVALIMLTITAITFWRMARRKSRQQELKEVGVSIRADVVELIRTNVTVNNHPLERLVCQYTLENGQHYIFKSDRLRLNPLPYLKEAGQVMVYHERGNPKNYFVDVDGSTGDVWEF